MKILFLLKRLFTLNYKRTYEDIQKISEESGKKKIVIALDMILSAFRYGAGPMDYSLFRFYEKNHIQRSSFVTRTSSTQMVRALNEKAYWKYLDSKVLQCKTYAPIIGRSWISTAEMTETDFQTFCNGKKEFYYKPDDGCCGKGIQVFQTDSQDQLYRKLKEMAPGILEETIIQHPILSSLNSSCVNTIRFVTVLDGDQVIPVIAILRMGVNDSPVDNLNRGGIAAKIDISTGRIETPATDKQNRVYVKHPESNVMIQGLQLPNWDQVLQVAKQAAKTVPELRYVGWDIAIRENDAILVEGNWLPGHDIMQLPLFCENGMGVLPAIKAVSQSANEKAAPTAFHLQKHTA